MRTATRVLLVEDNPIDAAVFQGFLRDLPGWTVDHVASLGAARAAVNRLSDPSAIDLVVVDLTLPDASGLEAVRFARERLPGAAAVVLTGESQIGTARRALRRGATDYLVKGSFQPQAFRNALQLARLRQDLVRQARDNARNLQEILSAMDAALFVVDDAGAVQFRNAAALELEVAFAPASQEGGGGVLSAEPGLVEQLRVPRVRGGRVPVEARATEITFNGDRAVLVVVRDLSAEHTAAVMQDKANQAAQLAEVGSSAMRDWHDVRKKLFAIQDAVARLEVGAPSPGAEAQDPLDTLREAQREILAIAERYRKHAVTMRNVREPVDLAELVRRKAAGHRARLETRAALTLRLQPVPVILGDGGELGRALENLLYNAAEALESAGREDGHIWVRTRAAGSEVLVEVADDGPGFPPGPTERWWKPRETSKARGTGLGLSQVRETVRRHGGDAEIVHQAGQGALIRLRLPVARSRPSSGEGRVVLVVDDDRLVRRATKRMLRDHYEVRVASDGQAALELLEEDAEVHAILCDLEMPRLDGPGVHESIAARFPELLSRLGFCSGGASTPEMLSFLEAVKPPMLPKPYEPDALIAMVEQLASGGGTPAGNVD